MVGERTFRIGKHRVNPVTGEIWQGTNKCRLEPRAMALLVFLANHPDEIFPIAELRRQVWHGNHVVDEAVKRCVSQIRKAFGDTPADATCIRTWPKRGYQLVAKVRPVSYTQLPARLAACLAGILLLLATASDNPENRRTADNPVSREELQNLALAHYHTYDADRLQKAADIYGFLLARNERNNTALTGMADTLLQMYLRNGRDNGIALRARELARQALNADPASPGAYKTMGAWHHFRGDPATALTWYQRAVDLDRTYWTALSNGGETLRDMGDFDAARQWFTCALQATPNKSDVLFRLAELEWLAGNSAASNAHLATLRMLDPELALQSGSFGQDIPDNTDVGKPDQRLTTITFSFNPCVIDTAV